MGALLSRADRIARGVLLHYTDLPKLVGPEWPRLYWSLLDRLDEFHAATDEDSRERITLALLDLLLQRPLFDRELAHRWPHRTSMASHREARSTVFRPVPLSSF